MKAFTCSNKHSKYLIKLIYKIYSKLNKTLKPVLLNNTLYSQREQLVLKKKILIRSMQLILS